MSSNPAQLGVLDSRLRAVCEEMGETLRASAFSTNIRDRLDYSCASFDQHGLLIAQAAHIPVHLGSMAYAVHELVSQFEWQPGDMVIVNDPFLGGTHLPDVTLIAPVFTSQSLIGFVANRAHYADIGASTPGSMPLATSLEEEGVCLPPTRVMCKSKLDENWLDEFLQQMHSREQVKGDLLSQIAANRVGIKRVAEIVEERGMLEYQAGIDELNKYGERLASVALGAVPAGTYHFQDFMDDDGSGAEDIPLLLKIKSDGKGSLAFDFAGTADQVAGNINCPASVTAAAVYYVIRCLLPAYVPDCAGVYAGIELSIPEGCLLNAYRPAAVAAGNVETSTRVVDLVLGALHQAIPQQVPAASHGSMNNIAMGGRQAGAGWDYYETIGGGMGASTLGPGLSACQTHMTNTLNTPIEVLETTFPLTILRYEVARGTGGAGRFSGGAGILREYQARQPCQVTLLTERRRHPPWGLEGGAAGSVGINRLNGQILPSKCILDLEQGDCLSIRTPGGGGFGTPTDAW